MPLTWRRGASRPGCVRPSRTCGITPTWGKSIRTSLRYRYLVVGSFLIVYRLADDDVILVLRVWDARQDPDRLAPE